MSPVAVGFTTRNVTNWLVAKVAPYDSSKLFSTTFSTAILFAYRDVCGYVLDFMHLLVMDEAVTPELNP